MTVNDIVIIFSDMWTDNSSSTGDWNVGVTAPLRGRFDLTFRNCR